MAKHTRGSSASKRREQRQQIVIYTVIIAAIVIIAAALVYSLFNAPPEVSAERLALEPVLGGERAPVTIVEYGAYGCHSCRAVHQSGVLQQLLATHGDNIRLVFRNFPVISPKNDPIAAEAAQCALDQGQDAFWALHETLYDLSDADYARLTKDEHFIDLATNAGIDITACMAADTHKRTVEHWEDDSRSAGVRGTPTFFVNGRLVGNASALESVVLAELGS